MRDRRATASGSIRPCMMALVIGVAACCGPSKASAWGGAGHRVIAAMAEARLSPPVAAEAHRLLAVSGARSLADVAAWADDVRENAPQSALAKATVKLHYVTFADSSCRYDARRDCPDGQCVVGAVERYAAVLHDRTRSDTDRAEALRFLVHFVGDAHQPLHAGYRNDRGGNNHQVQLDGKGTNLHAVWDRDILAQGKRGWRKLAPALQPPADAKPAGSARDWAEASCRMTRDDGVYPSSRKIGPRYLDAMRPLVDARLQRASIELAATLERALAR